MVWSAPVEDLTKWRYDGEIFSVAKNAKGEPFGPEGKADVLYAPDVTLVVGADGTKTYYLYPNDQSWGRNGLVAKSNRPDGPFEVCNWSANNPNVTDGVLAFDPAVFVDDDGRVYGYWGFERSYGAELDPATMATVKPGTQIVEDMVSGRNQEGIFSFFEASSIRKIKDKYVFIYSRFTKDGEFGLPISNYTLAYAYSDNPLGPWTYGGTIIDARGREIDEAGNVIASACIDGNTHGSICEINGQWYVFYHRQTGTDEYARQAMVAPITVNVEEGPSGKVTISEGEYNSNGPAGTQVRSQPFTNGQTTPSLVPIPQLRMAQMTSSMLHTTCATTPTRWSITPMALLWDTSISTSPQRHQHSPCASFQKVSQVLSKSWQTVHGHHKKENS